VPVLYTLSENSSDDSSKSSSTNEMAAMVGTDAYRQALTDRFPLPILRTKELKTVGCVICDC
jgi:hypothetical protein